MAWAGIISGLLGAAGSVAGGLLGQGSGGQGKSVNYNPALDYALQVAQYSAMDPLGFGTINNIPTPYQQLINKIQTTPMDSKTRRRAISALDALRNDPSLLADPYGRNFTQDQIAAAWRGQGVPEGRKFVFGGKGAQSVGEDHGPAQGITGSLPIMNLGRLQNALAGSGLTIDDLQQIFKQDAEQKAQIERLRAAGLGRLNEDTILNRAQASAAAGALLGDAGRFATGADPSAFQSGLLERINRNIDEQEQAYLLRAQYAGLNPGMGLQQFQQMRQDSEITGLTQAVQAAQALLGGLQGGTQGAQQAAQQSTNAATGALGIAANQALAANQLAQNAGINSSTSMANGASGAFGNLGQSLLLSSLFSQNGKPTVGNGTGTERGFNFNDPWKSAVKDSLYW